MNYKKFGTLLFVLMVLAQLYVPLSMIIGQENVLQKGKKYHFKTAPIDPNDPFRGKYIALNFEDNYCAVKDKKDWLPGDEVFGIIAERNGYAYVQSLVKEEPKVENYLKLTIQSHVDFDNINKVYFDYPFEKYYMEESKAEGAEVVYRERQIDTLMVGYAVVYIKNGFGAIHDVKVGDSSIKDMVR